MLNRSTGRDADKTICGLCSLQLAPGASHQDAHACVDALRAALDTALVCDGCGACISELCVSCTVKQAALNKGAQIGMGLFSKAQEHFKGRRDEARRQRKDGGEHGQ